MHFKSLSRELSSWDIGQCLLAIHLFISFDGSVCRLGFHILAVKLLARISFWKDVVKHSEGHMDPEKEIWKMMSNGNRSRFQLLIMVDKNFRLLQHNQAPPNDK